MFNLESPGDLTASKSISYETNKSSSESFKNKTLVRKDSIVENLVTELNSIMPEKNENHLNLNALKMSQLTDL